MLSVDDLFCKLVLSNERQWQWSIKDFSKRYSNSFLLLFSYWSHNYKLWIMFVMSYIAWEFQYGLTKMVTLSQVSHDIIHIPVPFITIVRRVSCYIFQSDINTVFWWGANIIVIFISIVNITQTPIVGRYISRSNWVFFQMSSVFKLS